MSEEKMQLNDVKVVKLKVSEIIPYWRNPRDSENAVPGVIESIKEFGYTQPIIVDSQNVIIAGHTRHKALIQLGVETADVIVSDMSQDQAHGYRVIDNKTNEKAKWKNEELIAELRRYTGLSKFEIHFPDLSIKIKPVNIEVKSISADMMERNQLINDSKFEKIVNDRKKAIQKLTCPHCGEEFETF